MNDRNFLLIYNYWEEGWYFSDSFDMLTCTHNWFETEEEMDQFIAEKNIKSEDILEKLEILNCRDLNNKQ